MNTDMIVRVYLIISETNNMYINVVFFISTLSDLIISLVSQCQTVIKRQHVFLLTTCCTCITGILLI